VIVHGAALGYSHPNFGDAGMRLFQAWIAIDPFNGDLEEG